MGFRLGFGGGCAPCCGGTTPPDACLGSCRPAGETRPISSVNVTLQAADYTVTFPGIGPAGAYTFHYKWPGSTYNGTFALTPYANGFQYNFPACGGCTPHIRYITTGTGKCHLSFNLPALVGYAAPTCASLAVFTAIPDISINACGTAIASIVDAGGRAAMKLEPTMGAWFLTPTFYNVLAAQITANINLPNTTTNHVIFETCSGTGGNYVGNAGMHVAAGVTGFNTYAITAPATITGSPLLQFAPLTVTYG